MLNINIILQYVSIPYRHLINLLIVAVCNNHSKEVSIPYRHLINTKGKGKKDKVREVSIPYRHLINKILILKLLKTIYSFNPL